MEWLNVIEKVGFPIACVVAMGLFIGYLVKHLINNYQELLKMQQEMLVVQKLMADDLEDIKQKLEKSRQEAA